MRTAQQKQLQNLGKSRERGTAVDAEDFAVRADLDDGRLTLSLTGELDLASAPILEEAIGAIPREDIRELVFDLQDLAFIDSTGLRLIIRTARLAADGGPRFAIQRVPDQARRLFEIAGVIERLNVQS